MAQTDVTATTNITTRETSIMLYNHQSTTISSSDHITKRVTEKTETTSHERRRIWNKRSRVGKRRHSSCGGTLLKRQYTAKYRRSQSTECPSQSGDGIGSDSRRGSGSDVPRPRRHGKAMSPSQSRTALDRRELLHIFSNLDEADGVPNGHIRRDSFVNWFRKLDGHSGRLDVSRLAHKADANDDGQIDITEFVHIVEVREMEEGTATDGSLLQKYLHVAGHAETYRWCPPPWFILVASAMQVGFFFYHVLHFINHEDHQLDHTPYQICSTLIFNPFRRHEVWRYLTYSLVHDGAAHLITNMLLQLLFGLVLEMTNGWKPVASVYLAGVLAGSLGTSSVNPNAYLLGASGAVFALAGANLASLLLNWKEDKCVMRQRFRNPSRELKTKRGDLFRLVKLIFSVLLCLLDFGQALYYYIALDGGPASVSYAAHISGLVAGFLLGISVMRNRHEEAWEQRLQCYATMLLLLLLIATVLWNLKADEMMHWIYGKEAQEFFLPLMREKADGHSGMCTY